MKLYYLIHSYIECELSSPPPPPPLISASSRLSLSLRNFAISIISNVFRRQRDRSKVNKEIVTNRTTSMYIFAL